MDKPDIDAFHTAITARLSSRKVRYTLGRKAVVESLSKSNGPLSAAELADLHTGTIPLSSLYRSLAILEDSQIITRHFGANGVTRYELAEWLLGHHHHLVCTSCGTVEDVSLPSSYESQIHTLVEEVGKLSSFQAKNHILDIEGICLRCT